MIRNSILFFACVVSLEVAACPPAQHEACETMKWKKLEMSVINSNIANLNTTRSPSGGPYKRQVFRCKHARCAVVSLKGSLLRYEPNHPDANEDGYVTYPDINLSQEMSDMINASREYDEAAKVCLSKQ